MVVYRDIAVPLYQYLSGRSKTKAGSSSTVHRAIPSPADTIMLNWTATSSRSASGHDSFPVANWFPVLVGAGELLPVRRKRARMDRRWPNQRVGTIPRFAACHRPPSDLSRIRISMLPVQAQGEVSLGQAQIQPDAAGSFTIHGLTPGRYRLMANIPSPRPDANPWQVKSSVVQGRETVDMPIDLRDGADDAVITFNDRVSELSGLVQDAGGQPAPEYHIVLFPRDKGYWTPTSRRIRTVRPAADGKYTITHLLIRGLFAISKRVQSSSACGMLWPSSSTHAPGCGLPRARRRRSATRWGRPVFVGPPDARPRRRHRSLQRAVYTISAATAQMGTRTASDLGPRTSRHRGHRPGHADALGEAAQRVHASARTGFLRLRQPSASQSLARRCAACDDAAFTDSRSRPKCRRENRRHSRRRSVLRCSFATTLRSSASVKVTGSSSLLEWN